LFTTGGLKKSQMSRCISAECISFQSDECLLLKRTNSQYGVHKARVITISYPEDGNRRLLLNLVQTYERARRHVPEGRKFNTEESRQAANATT